MAAMTRGERWRDPDSEVERLVALWETYIERFQSTGAEAGQNEHHVYEWSDIHSTVDGAYLGSRFSIPPCRTELTSFTGQFDLRYMQGIPHCSAGDHDARGIRLGRIVQFAFLHRWDRLGRRIQGSVLGSEQCVEQRIRPFLSKDRKDCYDAECDDEYYMWEIVDLIRSLLELRQRAERAGTLRELMIKLETIARTERLRCGGF